MQKLTVQQIREKHALIGAQYQIDALQQQIDQIVKAFPALATAHPTAMLDASQPAEPQKQRVRNWTKAQRAEASKRAKAMWAARKKGR